MKPSVRKPPPGNRPLKPLERVLSKAGAGSRTEARAWIAKGRVRVNGRVVTDADTWVDLERDRVMLDGKPLAAIANFSLHYIGDQPKGAISADYFGAFAASYRLTCGRLRLS